MSQKVYIVGSYIPSGGTFMAHSVGRLFEQRLNIEAVSIQVGNEDPSHGVFRYDGPVRMVSVPEALPLMRREDFVILCPGFSFLGLGPRTPATKIMYAQGFNTFQTLDAFCDHYVSVSGFVRSFLESVYGLTSTVIPAFTDTRLPQHPVPWHQRRDDLVLFANKGVTELDRVLEANILNTLRARLPSIRFEPLFPAGPISHTDVLQRLSTARYFLSLSISEGFGLLPLEAMAVGTVVLGWDGFGGREYMQTDWNCAAAPYPDFDLLIARALNALTNTEYSRRLSENAPGTSALYTQQRFEDAWEKFLRANVFRD
jgi:hypothetical protein